MVRTNKTARRCETSTIPKVPPKEMKAKAKLTEGKIAKLPSKLELKDVGGETTSRGKSKREPKLAQQKVSVADDVPSLKAEIVRLTQVNEELQVKMKKLQKKNERYFTMLPWEYHKQLSYEGKTGDEDEDDSDDSD